MNKARKGLMFVAWGILAIAMVFLVGFVTMHLWNWLVPALFNGPVITLWQGLGLLVLMKILTGIGGWGSHRGNHFGGGRHQAHWKKKWEHKMACMSDEEKAAFKEMYYKRCSKPTETEKAPE